LKTTRVYYVLLVWATCALPLGCAPQGDDVQSTAQSDPPAASSDRTDPPPATDAARSTNGVEPARTVLKPQPVRPSPKPTAKAATPTVIAWAKDWPTAQKAAAKSGKLIMIDFYTDWCGWCKRLDRDTFPNKAVIKLSQDFVPLKLNAEKTGRPLARRYGVRGYPTILFLDHKGKLVGRIGGYLRPGPFADALKRIQAKHKKL